MIFFLKLFRYLSLYLIIAESFVNNIFADEIPSAEPAWSLDVTAQFYFAPRTEITSHYENASYNLETAGTFKLMNISSQNWAAGAQADLFYHYSPLFFMTFGGGFSMDIPGGYVMQRVNSDEYLKESINFSIYMLTAGIGRNLLRTENFYVRGMLKAAFSAATLTRYETVSGPSFGPSRTNITGVRSWGPGLLLDLQVMYRLNIRNGLLLGVSGGFFSFGSWTGQDANGQEVGLFSVPLSREPSRSVLIYALQNTDIPGDESPASFLFPFTSVYIGYWQAL